MQSTWKLKGMLFFFHASMTIMISYLPVYFQYLGLSGSEIGVLLAVGPAASIIAQPFWGFMSDKWKTVKRVMLLCMSSAIAIGFLVFQMEAFLFILPILFVFFGFMSPSGALGDSLAQKLSQQRGVSFGSIRMWGSLGFGSASLAGGIILTEIGVWNMYYVYAAFMLLALSFTYFAPDSEPSKKPVKLSEALKLLKRRQLLLFLAVIFSISLTHRMNDSFIGLYVVELGGNETFIGLAWFIGVLTEALVFALSFYWVGRAHPLTFISLAALLYAFRWLLMIFVGDPVSLLFVQVLHGVTFGLFYLTAFQFVSKLVPEELTSTGHLLFISVFFGISGVAGSAFGGLVINAFNVNALYILMFFFASVGFIGSLVYRKYIFARNAAAAGTM